MGCYSEFKEERRFQRHWGVEGSYAERNGVMREWMNRSVDHPDCDILADMDSRSTNSRRNWATFHIEVSDRDQDEVPQLSMV